MDTITVPKEREFMSAKIYFIIQKLKLLVMRSISTLLCIRVFLTQLTQSTFSHWTLHSFDIGTESPCELTLKLYAAFQKTASLQDGMVGILVCNTGCFEHSKVIQVGMLLKFPLQLHKSKSRLCCLSHDTVLTHSLGIFITNFFLRQIQFSVRPLQMLFHNLSIVIHSALACKLREC